MSSSSDHCWGVVLAGGSGTRFWPKSRHHHPKQLCSMGDDKRPMIVKTLDRLRELVPAEKSLIVTHVDQAPQTAKITEKHCLRIIAEPEARNTAAALCLAALEIAAVDPEGVMISFHADHEIADQDQFIEDCRKAVKLAEQGHLVLLGIEPTRPETGYGYIEKSTEFADLPGMKVESFREKPSLDRAKEFVDSGNFLWNSGIFVWKVQTIIEEFERYLPDTLTKLKNLLADKNSFSELEQSDLKRCYSGLEKIAIDPAILEKSKKVAVVPSSAGWFDVGSWSSLGECYGVDENANVINGDVYALDVRNSIIESDGVFVSAIGVSDLVVVATKGAVLVCPKNRAQDVKLIVEHLKNQQRLELI
jgi:mannose-1-phosphate guanylyltransferase